MASGLARPRAGCCTHPALLPPVLGFCLPVLGAKSIQGFTVAQMSLLRACGMWFYARSVLLGLGQSTQLWLWVRREKGLR